MRITSLVAVLSTLVLAACAKDNAGTTDSAALADNANAANALATPATPALTDPNIFALLDEANMADSVAGKLASTKGTNADVKAFGVLMMNDHHALRKVGADLAAQLAIVPLAPPNDMLPMKASALTDSLTAMAKGAAWDKFYIDHEVMMHQEVLGLIDTALGAAQAPEVKDLLGKARPNIEMHLKRAQDIQAKIPAGSTN